MRPWMMRGVAAGLLALSQGCRSSGWPVGEETPGTVRALRYRILCFGSFLEFSHNAGTWVEELYFPEQGVLANLGSTSSWDAEKEEFKYQPLLRVFHGEIRNRFQLSLGAETETEQPVEEVRVPLDLARHIFALADLQKRMTEDSELLGARTERAGLLHMNVEPPSGGEVSTGVKGSAGEE